MYLDDVSVYSLIASRLGPVAVEFTDTETVSLQSEIDGTVSANLGVIKSEVDSKLQSNQGRGSQVLRKSIVQTTFKELYDLEKDHLVLRLPGEGEKPPSAPTSDRLKSWLRISQPPWVVPADELQRGKLIEIEVELETEPIFQFSTAVSTMLEIMRESPELAEMVTYEQLAQIRSIGRVLEKLLTGLIPVRARLVDYVLVNAGDGDRLVHRDTIKSGQISSARLETRSINLVGIAEESLFWRDIRRVLFARARYRVLCRIARSGVSDAWTPVKLSDVFKEIAPDIADGLELFNRVAAVTTAGQTTAAADRRYQTALNTALAAYAQSISERYEQKAPEDARTQQFIADLARGATDMSLPGRRQSFKETTKYLEANLGISVDPVIAASLRAVAQLDAGLALDGRLNAGPEDQANNGPAGDERFLDVELVAIYW